MNKRHAKPTNEQLLNRIYRRQIALESAVQQIIVKGRDRSFLYNARIDTLVSAQKMLSERMESFRVLVDHCHRLLKEKETLQRQIEQMLAPPNMAPGTPTLDVAATLSQANTYMAQSIPTLSVETCEYSCGCSTTGTAPGSAYCGIHNKPIVSKSAQKIQFSRRCSFANTHRPGIICAVCGIIP